MINNAGLHLTKYNQPFGVLSRKEIREPVRRQCDGRDQRDSGVPRLDAGARWRGGAEHLVDGRLHERHAVLRSPSSPCAALTVAFATELAPDRIRVNAIAPGLMNTENALADLPKPLIDEFTHRLQLVHRLGTMDDIVSAMLFLCSDEASFITGETLKVSGGYPLNF